MVEMNPTGLPHLSKQLRDQNTSSQEGKPRTICLKRLTFLYSYTPLYIHFCWEDLKISAEHAGHIGSTHLTTQVCITGDYLFLSVSAAIIHRPWAHE